MRIIEDEAVNDQGLILGESARPANIRARLEAFESLKPIANGAVLADIGCGRAGYSLELARKCRRISLIDIQQKNIEMAKAAFAGSSTPADFYCAPAENLPLNGDSYDSVFMIEVLDHVREVSTCLREAWRVLRSGGCCYISVPNRLFPFETHPVRLLGVSVNPRFFPFLTWLWPLHKRMATARVFTPGQLRRLGLQAGFCSANFGYVMPPFEKTGVILLRRLANLCQNSPLRIFGVSIAMVFTK